ncbi:MAG: response regulator [Planctomycetota bacterium]
MKSRTDLPIQTLHLNDRDKAKLLWAIDQASTGEHDEQREVRVSCTNNEAVLTLKTDGGGETRLSVLARNLSRKGVALVHGRYIYPKSRCEVSLQALNSAWHSVLGTVQHVRHVQGTIHELGVHFDEPIDLSDFVTMSSEEETRYLRELADNMPEGDEDDTVQLANRVLVVDDFASDRKLISHWLTQAGLNVSTAADMRSAIVQVQEQVFDLALVDYLLGADSGVDLIRELRENQFVAPIISISADETEELKAEVTGAGATCFMRKPMDAEALKQTAFELIGIDASSDLSPIFSQHKNDPEMRPLITEFTRSLAGYVEELRDANAQNNYESLELISRQLKGAGNGYGFPTVSETAGELLQSINADDADIDAIRQQASELITTLNRIKLG